MLSPSSGLTSVVRSGGSQGSLRPHPGASSGGVQPILRGTLRRCSARRQGRAQVAIRTCSVASSGVAQATLRDRLRWQSGRAQCHPRPALIVFPGFVDLRPSSHFGKSCRRVAIQPLRKQCRRARYRYCQGATNQDSFPAASIPDVAEGFVEVDGIVSDGFISLVL